ncbi:MAG: prolipoprotein diacylglyceryl transferase [Rhodobacteraceae bacterium]|nr:prolipoprotein diacylglyceryl transferase [Paracoccaceae bacterium]
MLAAIPFPDISPEIFTIRIGEFAFSLRWYALAYIVGILAGWRIGVRLVNRADIWPDGPPMKQAAFEDFVTWIIIGIVLGGRLGFVLFYQPAHYLANPLDIVKVWQGGMAFHGGFLGVALAVWVFSRRNGISLGHLSDAMALCVPPGLMLGRIANFVNAELWGRPTDLPWGVIFPGAAAQDCAGVVAGFCARHPSQLYEAALEGLILGSLLLYLALRRGWLRTPWQLTGLFLAGYGLSRFVVEFFRQADPQFITPGNPTGHVVRLGEAGVTMGQLLSLPMLIIGVAVILRARRRPT